MTDTTEPRAHDALCDALRSILLRRAGNLLQRVSVVGSGERIVIEISCRSYYAAQLALSAIADSSSMDRKPSIRLSIRVNGRVLVLHLHPAPSATSRVPYAEERYATTETAARSTTRDLQLQNAT